MADVSKLQELSSGVPRSVDIAANTLVTTSVKVGGGTSNTELTKAILDALLASRSAADLHIASTANPHSVTKSQILSGNLIVDADVDAAAAIAQSKLSLSITDSEVNASAAIATSKLADSANFLLGNASHAISDTVRYTYAVAQTFAADGDLVSKKYVDDQVGSASFITSITDTNSIDLTVGTQALSADLRLDGTTLAIGAAGVKVNEIANAEIAAAAAIALDKLAAATASRALVSDASGFVSASSVTATELGYVSGVTSAIQTQLNNLSSLVQNFEWQASVIDRLEAPPVSPTTGDRYLVIATASGAWLGEENNIAEWNGTAWVFTAPTLGTYLGVDAENDGLYLYGGSSWDKKYFEATTASTGLTKVGFDVRLADAVAANGISVTSGAISAVVDDSSIEINGSAQLQVKDLGITNAMLAGSIAYAKLNIVDGDLTIAKTSGLQSALDGKVDGNTAITGATKTKITYDAKGLVTAGDDATTTDIAEGANLYFTDARAKSAAVADSITDGITDVAPSQNAVFDALALKADIVHHHDQLKKTMVAGEEFLAGTYFVRIGTGGKVFKADYDASANDNFYAYGVVQPEATIAADANIDVILMGEITLSAAFFEVGEVGQPVHLIGAGAFDAVSQITYAVDQASYRVGIVVSTTNILVGNFQLMAIA